LLEVGAVLNDRAMHLGSKDGLQRHSRDERSSQYVLVYKGRLGKGLGIRVE
jgi:hypothetical protein